MYFFILLISTAILKMSFIHQTSFRNNLPCLHEKLHYFFFFIPLNRRTALSWMELWWSAHRDCQALLTGNNSIMATGCVSSSVCVRMGHCSRFRWQVITWVVRLLSIHVEPRTETQTTTRRVLLCVYICLYEVIACLQGFLFLQKSELFFLVYTNIYYITFLNRCCYIQQCSC